MQTEQNCQIFKNSLDNHLTIGLTGTHPWQV